MCLINTWILVGSKVLMCWHFVKDLCLGLFLPTPLAVAWVFRLTFSSPSSHL